MEANESAEEAGTFSQRSQEYWAKVPANIDGMLGGFSSISSIDVQTSARFLQQYIKGKGYRIGTSHALDCGCGIGRVTKHLLSNYFDKVDMVDQNPVFLEEAKEYLGDRLAKVDRFICSGLQDFQPEAKKYDVIWVQWVCSAMVDDSVTNFLTNCKNGLKAKSILFLKENIAQEEEEKDEEDCSIIRTGKHFRQMIRSCGYIIMKELKQPKFPQELFEVRIFACRLPT